MFDVLRLLIEAREAQLTYAATEIVAITNGDVEVVKSFNRPSYPITRTEPDLVIAFIAPENARKGLSGIQILHKKIVKPHE